MSPSAPDVPVNLDYWEQAAATHGTTDHDTYYHLDKVVAGGTLMTEHEERAVALATGAPAEDPLSKVTGLHVLYLQSHIGVDGVVLARAGARVTCADFSPTALERAHALAARVGVEIQTVETDSRAIPDSLHGRFDIVYVTIGAICWIDDLDVWMLQVALALRPGGRLVMMEIHPIYNVFYTRTPELVADFPYGGGTALTETDTGTYADPTSTIESTTTCFAHSIGDIVSSAIGAGLRVDHLDEHTHLAFNPRGDDVLRLDPDGQYRLRLGRGREAGVPAEPLPIAFTLLATRNG
jgi:SAM-dependent methyltransferase